MRPPEVLTAGNRERHVVLTVLDALTWVRTELLPKLTVTRPLARAVLHPTCAMGHLGTTGDLHAGAHPYESVLVALERATRAEENERRAP
ncbi:hypothetical protein [Actinomadura sp. 21ATH]|uniref:hypothetical protein n=1 Tax=Actinomadura sp. 21ATH TaxID=1735444 RepID=UPI0035C1CC11